MPLSERTLRSILARWTPSAATRRASIRVAGHVARKLEGWGESAIVKASVFGSVAKGTDVVGGTDVDLFVSLSSRTAATLSEMREGLFKWLYYDCGHVVRRQNVSIRVHVGDKKIDVVPGKRLNEHGSDHHLWSRDGESRTKTNIKKQIQHVKATGRQKEIRLVKIWRTCQGLTCPSFLLELAIIRALHRRRRGRLASNFQTILEYLSTTFPRARLTDPGNRSNVVSDGLSQEEKWRIATAAAVSMESSSTARAFLMDHSSAYSRW